MTQDIPLGFRILIAIVAIGLFCMLGYIAISDQFFETPGETKFDSWCESKGFNYSLSRLDYRTCAKIVNDTYITRKVTLQWEGDKIIYYFLEEER